MRGSMSYRANKHAGHEDVKNEPLPPIQHVQRTCHIVLREREQVQREGARGKERESE